LNSSSSVRHKT